jgi:diaminopimelate epimerase
MTTAPLSFKKMHGLGNDFVMVRYDALPDVEMPHLQALAQQVCHRQFGVGADGLIIAAPSQNPAEYDIRFIYINNDGTLAEMCGNGMRCFARFVFDEGLVQERTFRVETLAGMIQPTLHPDGEVTVNMGPPILEPARVPFTPLADDASPAGTPKAVNLFGGLECWPVSMGNPHAILFEDAPGCQGLIPAEAGPQIETHSQFPAKTNVEFVSTLGPQAFEVIVWERGCGFTLACGTGACATAVAAILSGRASAEHPVSVRLPGGELSIEWAGHMQAPVMMTGPATYSFEGILPADALENAFPVLPV